MAKSLQIAPSKQLGITDPFVAYCLDAAVTRWGTSFDAAVSDAVSEAKTQEAAQRAQDRIVRRWIPAERRYAELPKQ